MFDLRYHVASLAAVFVALVIGIFVGVGLSGKGVRQRRGAGEPPGPHRRAPRGARRGRRPGVEPPVRGDALDDFAGTAYPELVDGRLDGKAVGIVFVGSVDQGVAGAIRRAVADAGGRIALMRALRVPLDSESVDEALAADPEMRSLAGPERRERLGRELARRARRRRARRPICDGSRAILVEEQSGSSPVSSTPSSSRRPARAAAGRDAGLPRRALRRARGHADPDRRRRRARDAAERRSRSSGAAASRPSTAIDTAAGRVALVFLLAGARPGSYGMRPGRRRRRAARRHRPQPRLTDG